MYHDIALKGRCSALVAVTPDFSDIFLGHSTWDSYSQMTKVRPDGCWPPCVCGRHCCSSRGSGSSFVIGFPLT